MKRALPRAALALLAVAFMFMADVQSQQRKRTSRRATSRVRPQPVPTPQLPGDEPTVVSTADDPQEAQPSRRTSGRTTRPSQQSVQSENDRLHGTVRDLSTQVEQLSGQLNQMKVDQRAMYDLERLTRAEQRAEDLRRNCAR